MENEGLNIGGAISAMKQGFMVQRKGWNGKGLFVFMQVPANIDVDTVVPNMQSLPLDVKTEIINRRRANGNSPDHFSIRYRNQLALLHPDNIITGWSPSASDALATDWVVVKID